jgi:hypothetical protein
MKIAHMFAAAGLMVATLGIGTAAEAQPGRGDRWDHHDRGRHNGWDRNDRRHGRWDRHDRRDRRHWNNGRRNRSYAYRNGYNNRCWTEWRYNQRIRICR